MSLLKFYRDKNVAINQIIRDKNVAIEVLSRQKCRYWSAKFDFYRDKNVAINPSIATKMAIVNNNIIIINNKELCSQ